MAKNEFLPFAQAEGANVLSNDEYDRLKTRSSGFQAGVARAQELNKVWRQSSVITHVIAQFMADNTGRDILDDGDISQLSAALTEALLSKIAANVPAATLNKPGIVQLSNETDSDNETMAATPKAVKAVCDLVNKISIDGIYPVGIVTWFAQNNDPNTLFPGTTWKYIGENRTIRLAAANGSDVMTTGGTDSVTLAVVNIPEHGHTFSANTSSFDYGTKTSSSTDLGTKTSSTFDYGTKTTNTTGAHTHTIDGRNAQGRDTQLSFMSTLEASNPSKATSSAGNHNHTVAIGAHTHTVAIGAHSHSVGIGAHTHSVSGFTAKTGSGSAVSVTNAFIKLMGWYRSA